METTFFITNTLKHPFGYTGIFLTPPFSDFRESDVMSLAVTRNGWNYSNF